MKQSTMTACAAAMALLACALLAPSPAAAARCLNQAPTAAAPPLNDTQILNFALNLEYLEAEFYSWAATGAGIPAALRGGGPPSRGGRRADVTPGIQAILNEIATDEINHVAFLRSVLGAAAVPIPLIDIGPAFATAANAALNQTLNPPFSPYVSDVLFLHGAFIFEDVGVTAYKGAAPLISSKTYLGAAAGILAVEAYHAGVIRSKLSEIANTIVQPYGVPVADIVQAISNLRATLSGADDDQGIVGNTPGSVNLVPTDSSSIVFSRTPRQVLNIVYGAPNVNRGLFFPNGISA